MKVLADFKNLTLAEAKLVNWLQEGNRKTCIISDSVPDSPSDDVTLRATFIRYLALGGCDTCRLPETGLRAKGAYVIGDEDNSESTNGLDLEGATLPHDLALFDCHIPDPIILRSAKVKNLFLHGSDVKAAIKADGLQADGGVFLRGAKIAGEVRLLGAQLGGELECEGAALQAKGMALNCYGATISGTFFLREGAKVSGCIDMNGATLGAINDDPACWPPELILDRCYHGAFEGNNASTDAKTRLAWLALQKPQKYGHDFWPGPYEHCAKVLREMGHGADATKILIEKERLQRKARRERLLSKRFIFSAILFVWFGFWDWVLGWSVSYGRQPLWAFVWLLGFWAFGALMFDQAAQRGEIKPNLPQIQRAAEWVECADGAALRLQEHAHQPDCFHAQPEGQSHPRFNAIFYSADTLFPVVALEMQSYWIPDDTKPFGKYARWYLWLHIIAGWALTLLAVAGFSGLIKTDNTK